MSAKLQCYWGGLCLCGKYHPVKLATQDRQERVPQVLEYAILCPNRLEDIRFEIGDIVKYLGPMSDEMFQTHQLFQESGTPQDHD